MDKVQLTNIIPFENVQPQHAIFPGNDSTNYSNE